MLLFYRLNFFFCTSKDTNWILIFFYFFKYFLLLSELFLSLPGWLLCQFILIYLFQAIFFSSLYGFLLQFGSSISLKILSFEEEGGFHIRAWHLSIGRLLCRVDTLGTNQQADRAAI